MPRAASNRSDDAPRPLAFAALLVLFGALMLGFAAWQYRMPPDYESTFFYFTRGSLHFAQHLLPRNSPPASVPEFVLGYRILLGVAWAAYALLLLLAARGCAPSLRVVLWTGAALAAAFAVLCPPSLSRDLYFYAAYARIGVVHGLNPYLTTGAELARIGDPVSRFYAADWPTVYGPVWTLLGFAIALPLRAASLWSQVVGLKLLEAAALLLAARMAVPVVERFAPGRGLLAAVAVAFNPFFLVEGVGNGHNDLLMMALAVAAVALHVRGRSALAYAVLGLSVGVKFITVALLPWLVLEEARGARFPRLLFLGARALLLALLPTLLLGAPFWAGPETLSGPLLQYRTAAGAEALARATAVRAWVAQHGGPAFLGDVAVLLQQHGFTLLLYGSLTLWVWRSARPGGYRIAWVLFTTLLPFLAFRVWYPWYLTWGCMMALLCWDPPFARVPVAVVVIAALLSFAYSVPFRPAPQAPIPGSAGTLARPEGRRPLTAVIDRRCPSGSGRARVPALPGGSASVPSYG